RFGLRELWPKVPKLQLVRGLFHAGGMLLWFAALPMISIAELTAIGFSGPLFICLGAVLFLGERMTGARWVAVLVGFLGVVLVVHPFEVDGFSGISTGMLLMLASAPVFAGSFLVAKVLTRHERSDIMVFWQHLVVSLLLLPFAYFWWMMPSPRQWAMLVVCGFLGAGGHYCMTRAFRVADISAVQSVKFLELVWAAILGFFMFGTIPAGWTLAGGVVILASTLWLARREARASPSGA
ncbi:MAG: DMT family transporter, partial [Betaproteobacteria bacterium]|nr:DMT family transporter [Betaproteobacteria bacterium]MSQ88633.1 DMT family transporter [Betaproteobacteria bacterium]